MRLATRYLLVAVCACGDNDPCAPVKGSAVLLGAGIGQFESMPPVLDISDLGQAGYPFLPLRTRIWGIPPGDPTDPLTVGNPATTLDATADSLSWSFHGTLTLGYMPSAERDACHGDDLAGLLRVPIGGPKQAQEFAGQEVKLAVTVAGNDGTSASDAKAVIVGSYPGQDAGVDAP